MSAVSEEGRHLHAGAHGPVEGRRQGPDRRADAPPITYANPEDDRGRMRAIIDGLFSPHVLLRAARDDGGEIVDFLCTDINRVACEYIGLPYDDLVGARVLALLPGLADSGLLAMLGDSVDSGQPLVLEDFAYTPKVLGGPERRYDLRAIPLGDALSLTWQDVTANRETSDALAESETRFHLAFDTIGDTLVLYRPVFDSHHAFVDAEITWINRAARVRWFGGASLEETRGVHLFEHTPMFRVPFFEIFRTVVEDGARVQRIISLTHPVEGELFLDINVTPFEGGFTYASRDITEKHRAQLAMEESEARFRLLAENASDVVFTANNEGFSTWVSPSLTALVGWLPEQLIGRPFAEFVHPDDLPTLRTGQATARGGKPGSYELRVRTTTGGYRWVLVSLHPLFDDEGNVIGRAGGWRDVQAEVESRRSLAASQALLRSTIDTLLDPLVLLEAIRDKAGCLVDLAYVDANYAACDEADMDRERLWGQRLKTLMPGLAGPVVMAQYARTLETGEPLVLDGYEYRSTPDAPDIRHDIRAVRVGANLSLTWHDVTEHHRTERTLRRRVLELDAVRRISQLLAASSDPRNVLEEVSSEIGSLLGAHSARVHVLPDGSEAHAESRQDVPATLGTPGEHHLTVPMIAGSRSVGALVVRRHSGAFTDGEVALAGTVADLLAAALRNAQLHEVEKRAAASEERQRLARDLHDAVTQSIYSASLIAEALPSVWDRSPTEGMRSILTMRVLVRAALAELRTLLYELRPAALESAPLSTLILRLSDSLRGRAEIAIAIAVPDDVDLPDQTKVAFYRVAQEALNNVGKHAHATLLKVSVTDDGEAVQLCVRDDGRGFALDAKDDPAVARPEAFGLQIMRDRADEIGATFSIESAPQNGTTVSMVWPRPTP